jgi:hypothetical protein
VRVTAVAVLVLALTACSLGGDDGKSSAVDEAQYIFDLGPMGEDDPEPVGRAGLSATPDGKTEVVVELDDPPDATLGGDVRSGGCVAGVRSSGTYPLEGFADGRSTTVVDVDVAELLRNDYIILIRPVGQQSVLSGICGDTANAEENS